VLGIAKAFEGVIGVADGAIGAINGLTAVFAALTASNVVGWIGNATLGLTSLQAGAAATATALNTALVPALAAAASGFVGWQIGTLINDVTGASTAISDLALRLTEANPSIIEVGQSLGVPTAAVAELAQSAGLSAREIASLHQQGLIVYDDAQQAFRRTGQALAELDGAQAQAASSTFSLANAAAAARDTITAAGGSVDGLSQSQIAAAASGGTLAASLAQTEKSALQAQAAAEAYQLRMLELASDERIAMIEGTVAINTAGLEADAERVKATFASIDSTVASSTSLLQTLYGQMGQVSGSEAFKIQSAIRKETELRQQAIELQQQLVQAEINHINARTRMLNQGGASINITADGLEPELETILFRVIDKARVAVAGSYPDLLIGCGGP
jgi:hypothetical protein